MRRLSALTLVMVIVLGGASARADTAEPATVFFAGGSMFLAGFAVGGLLIGTGNGHTPENNAGWLTIDAGFVLAPLLSHALTGEWNRALVFTALPAAAFGGTATLLAIHPAAIEHGELADQRLIWSLFGIGLFSSVVGIVDAALATERAGTIALSPVVAPGQVGLRLGGIL